MEQFKNLDREIHEVALREGWDVFYTGNNLSMPEPGHLLFEVQRIDDEKKFASDDEAIDHVIAQALKGSEPHYQALKYVVDHAEVSHLDAIPDWNKIDLLVYLTKSPRLTSNRLAEGRRYGLDKIQL